MKSTAQELIEYLDATMGPVSDNDSEAKRLSAAEAAVHWLCCRIDEMKEAHARHGHPFGGTGNAGRLGQVTMSINPIIDRLLSLFVVPERERLRNLLVPELADLRQQLDQARRLAGEAQARFREAAGVRDRLASELSTRNDEAVDGARERDRLAAELARVERISLDQLSNTIDALNRLAGCVKERDQLRADLEHRSEQYRNASEERGQLRADRDRQLTALAEMRESLRVFADSAAKERDALMGEVAKHRARVAELETGIALYRSVGFPSERPVGQSEIEARLAADGWEAKRHMKDIKPELTADGQPITYVDADEQPTHRHFPKPGGFYP